MATNQTNMASNTRLAVTQQPRTYQEMLNYLLPTKTDGSKVYVPRITTNNPSDADQLNNFVHWHGASGKSPHTHVGDDIAFSELNTATGNVEYCSTRSAFNQNVSVGAPVGGVLSIVPHSDTNEVRITTPAGMVFSVLHMTGLDGSLNGTSVAPGTPIGTMASQGADRVVHVHLGVSQDVKIQNADGTTTTQTRYYDPQEVLQLGTTGRYVVRDDMGKKPAAAVVNTPASQAFWRNNTNPLGEGQREVTARRTMAVVNGVRTVTTTYGGQTIVNTYGSDNKSTGGPSFVADLSQTNTNSGNWLSDAQARQNKAVQAALSVVLPAESYRNNIYHLADGIPTTGYGYALVIKDGDAYKARPEEEVKASLRLAGVDAAAIAKIDYVGLKEVAKKLNALDYSGANAITDSMADTVIFSSPTQAQLQVSNRLAVGYQGLTRTLGGVDVANGLTANQMGATLSLYDNSPKLVGDKLVKALKGADVQSARREIEANSNVRHDPGLQNRRDKEAALFSNPEPVSSDTSPRTTSNPTPLGTAAPTDPRIPYRSTGKFTKNPDGGFGDTYTANADSPNGWIAKGDTVTYRRNPNGALAYLSVSRVENGEKTVNEHNFDTGSNAFTRSDKNGQVQDHIAIGADNQLLGDNYVSGGATFTRTEVAPGMVQWLDANGNTPTERTLQGMKDSDAHIDRYAKVPVNPDVADAADRTNDSDFAQNTNEAEPQPATTPSSSADRVQSAITDLIGGKQLPNRLGRVAATTDADIKPFWVPIMGGSNDADSEGADAATALCCPWTHTIHLNADQINQGDEAATLAQALMHKHGQSVLGQTQWDRLNDAVHAWQDADPQSDEYAVYNYARNQAQAAGADPDDADLLPYALEATQQLGKALKPGSAARWQESVRQNMKVAWKTITDNPDLFKEQDLAELAHGMAQRDGPVVVPDEAPADSLAQEDVAQPMVQYAVAA